MIAEATGNPPIAFTEMVVAAWRGEEREAAELIEATVREATAARPGGLLRGLRERGSAQRSRAPRRGPRRRSIGLRAGSSRVRAVRRARARRGGGPDR